MLITIILALCAFCSVALIAYYCKDTIDSVEGHLDFVNQRLDNLEEVNSLLNKKLKIAHKEIIEETGRRIKDSYFKQAATGQ